MAVIRSSAAAAAFAADVGGEVIDWNTVLALPAHEGLLGHHHGDNSEAGQAEDPNSEDDHDH